MKEFICGIKLQNCLEEKPIHHCLLVKQRVALKKLFAATSNKELL